MTNLGMATLCWLLLAGGLTPGSTIARDASEAKDEAVEARLKDPLRLSFRDAPLREVLEYVERAAAGDGHPGLPIAIDPGAAGRAVAARVSYETEEGEPLGEALSYLLGRHQLRYKVRDGGLRIEASRFFLLDRRKQDRAIRDRLEARIDLKLEKAPLDEAIRAIQAASRGSDAKGGALPIYIDPVGLQEAEVSPTTPVSLEAHRVPVKAVLDKLLGPLGLTYVVKDGLVTISIVPDDAPAGPPPRHR